MVQHFQSQGARGGMNRSTAHSLATACRQVLEIDDGWESTDARSVNVEETLRRFRNKKHHQYKEGSLSVYEARFRRAVKEFLDYSRRIEGEAPTPRAAAMTNDARTLTQPEITGTDVSSLFERTHREAFIDYPFPLRDHGIARLRLPADLNHGDVERITRFLKALAMDTNSDSGK